MRIAVYHNLPSGGAKRTLYEEVRRLTGKHHIDVFTLSSANHEFADLRPFAAHHKVYDFEPRPLFSSPFGRLNQAVRLNDLKRVQALTKIIAQDIEQGDYDVCLLQPCQFETSPSLIRYLQNTPTVYFCQEPLRRLYEEMPERPYDKNDTGMRSIVDRIDPLIASYLRVLRKTDQANTRGANIVLVNSNFVKDAVKEIYEVEAKVCYHGIDADWFQPSTDEKQDFLLSVGSLTPLKGFDFLIEAVSLVPKEIRPPLLIVSNFQNPPEKEYLTQLAHEKDVALKLEGNISEERLVQLYNQTKIAVYAAIREPFGLVPVEAMACETTVIAVQDGGVQETILDNQTGLLVERDPNQFAQAIQDLLSNPEKSQAFGKKGREQVLEKWTWEKAIYTLEGYLEAASKMKKE
jgi:glycosyltransferase involved in cell wall biosynthesis